MTRLSSALALAGLAAAVGSLLLPWLSVFGGLAVLNGIGAGGGTLAGIAVASALVLLAAHRYSWATGRWLALAGAAAAAAGSLWSAHTIADYAAEQGPAAVLASPVPGPGPWVLAAGAGLVLAGTFQTPSARARPRRPDSAALEATLGARLGLGATAFAGGWIHLLLVPEHWGESVLLGAGFLGAGILQIILALGVVERPGFFVYLALVALNVALIGVWIYAVFVGLPLGDPHDHGERAGWAIGAGEPIDAVGAAAKAAELAGAVWAAVLSSRPARPAPG